MAKEYFELEGWLQKSDRGFSVGSVRILVNGKTVKSCNVSSWDSEADTIETHCASLPDKFVIQLSENPVSAFQARESATFRPKGQTIDQGNDRLVRELRISFNDSLKAINNAYQAKDEALKEVLEYRKELDNHVLSKLKETSELQTILVKSHHTSIKMNQRLLRQMNMFVKGSTRDRMSIIRQSKKTFKEFAKYRLAKGGILASAFAKVIDQTSDVAIPLVLQLIADKAGLGLKILPGLDAGKAMPALPPELLELAADPDILALARKPEMVAQLKMLAAGMREEVSN